MININEILPFLLPVAIIQFGLQIYSMINLVKRNKVRFNNKILWGFIILVFGVIGSVIYLVARGDDE